MMCASPVISPKVRGSVALVIGGNCTNEAAFKLLDPRPFSELEFEAHFVKFHFEFGGADLEPLSNFSNRFTLVEVKWRR